VQANTSNAVAATPPTARPVSVTRPAAIHRHA
jgi:hypothetical protein